MAKPLCVGSSKPTIKDNRLEKTGFLSFVSNTCKDFTVLPLIMTNGIFVIQPVQGQELEVPVYKFVKEALVRKFGEDWYAELETVAEEYKTIQNR
jgi:hypothetical protein